MKEGNLPTEIAQEPAERAQLSQGEEYIITKTTVAEGITFDGTTQFTKKLSQAQAHAGSLQKDSQDLPSPSLSHRQRLQWLQRHRCTGLWAQCDDCLSWRYLPDVLDAHELPHKWKCRMNPDKAAADCSVPEVPIRVRADEDLIHGEYAAGSLVWARLSGWPWWPAMVDDDPDIEQYYWFEGFCDKLTHYNVTFFDSSKVTRSWLTPEDLMPFGPNKRFHRRLPKDKKTKIRMEAAIAQAEDAEKLPLAARLAKYSFVSRYPDPINTPRKINKKEMLKYKDMMIGNYNIAFSDDSCESSDDDNNVISTKGIKRRGSVLLVGSHKTNATLVAKKTRRFSAF